LTRIISQSEFRESIDQINRKISIRKTLIIICVIIVLLIGGGAGLFFSIDDVEEPDSDSGTSGLPTIAIVGIALFILGLIFVIGVLVIFLPRRTAQIRKAIAEESIKYSSRSCNWRLDVMHCDTPTYYVNVITLSKSSCFFLRILVKVINH
jgi:hypothetical protein